MKLALSLLFLTLSFNTHASPQKCLAKLTVNFSQDSHSFTLYADEVQPNFGKDYLAEAIYAIRMVANKIGCSRRDINFGEGPLGRSQSHCSRLNGEGHSRLCYVETNLGYFFVSRDMLKNYIITFNRWD